ncbi:MMPL family transporter [Solicola sp. PLA-1-18]|uniref:MMPL family transporter n=1 Tax=Solicola sp. PLA-1-18 TaxID=3380532 RepID=UPI003B7BA45A
MSRLADAVLSHRLLVVLVWLVIAGAGAATTTRTVDALSYDFGLPGQPAYEANTDIQRQFGGGGLVDPVVLTVRAPAGTDLSSGEGAAAFAQVAEQVAASAPGTRVVVPGDGEARALVSPDGRRAVALLYPRVVGGPDPYARALPAIERAASTASVAGVTPQLTGTALLAESSGGDRGVLVEVVLGGAGALIVLAVVFGSLLAGVPLLVAAVSILGTYLALLGLTSLTDVSFVVQYLVALIGLGVAIDYSLLIVMRWREERSHGADNDTAVRTAVATAGRSVLFSGVTVAVSLAALVAVPLPFLRSIGLGGLLIPVLSVATSLTLVPVVLHVAGPRLQWPRRTPHDPTSRRWATLARVVVRRRWIVIVATVALLAAMTAPLLTLRLGSPEIEAYGSDSAPGRAAQGVVDDGVAAGVVRPTEVLVDAADAARVASLLAAVPGIAAATSVDAEGWTVGGTSLLQVWSEADPATSAGSRTLDRVRTVADGQGARVGGTPAEDADFVTAVYGDAVWVLLGIVVITFLLLARALRSLWLPVKALVLNVISIGAAYGITVLIWQNGLGTEQVFGASASGTITVWVPVAVFAFLFGLSMDYEVFILSRMREAYDEHGDTHRAVVDGISRTGRLVTSAALILFLAFIALSTVPSIDVKILATALALGIAIDALVVRALLAPALVAVLGRANWTMPRGLARALRVRDAEGGSGRARHRASL